MNDVTLTLIRGVPGSGKSTLAKQLPGIHIEADMYFNTPKGYVYDSSKIRDAHEWCKTTCRALICSGNSVIVSNTFTKLWEIAAYVKIARECGITLDVRHCTGTYGSIHNVPEEVILRMRKSYEPYVEDSV